MRNTYKIIILSMFILGLQACDKRKTSFMYMPDMADSPAVKAQESFLNPPDHSVARNAIFYPKTAEKSETQLRNPLEASDENLKEGASVYNKVCIVCHGPNAQGAGSLTKAYPKAPDLTLNQVSSHKDGWFFHRISFGIGVMPGYRHSITSEERWQIIHYLRTLQKKAR